MTFILDLAFKQLQEYLSLAVKILEKVLFKNIYHAHT